jgi:hypothetical protein
MRNRGLVLLAVALGAQLVALPVLAQDSAQGTLNDMANGGNTRMFDGGDGSTINTDVNANVNVPPVGNETTVNSSSSTGTGDTSSPSDTNDSSDPADSGGSGDDSTSPDGN